jgi:hypothetical protein
MVELGIPLSVALVGWPRCVLRLQRGLGLIQVGELEPHVGFLLRLEVAVDLGLSSLLKALDPVLEVELVDALVVLLVKQLSNPVKNFGLLLAGEVVFRTFAVAAALCVGSAKAILPVRGPQGESDGLLHRCQVLSRSGQRMALRELQLRIAEHVVHEFRLPKTESYGLVPAVHQASAYSLVLVDAEGLE